MKLLARIIVGLIGIASALAALKLWFDMGPVLAQFGIETKNLAGRATVRADIGGLFMGLGVMSMIAAWQQSRIWALRVMVLAGCALAGRLVTVALDGTGPDTWGPVVVEAVAIVILYWARTVWRQAH
jgi:hypothetical protein